MITIQDLFLNQLWKKRKKKFQTDAKWSRFLSGSVCYLRINNISSLLILNEMKWQGFAWKHSCHSNCFVVSWLSFHCRCSSHSPNLKVLSSFSWLQLANAGNCQFRVYCMFSHCYCPFTALTVSLRPSISFNLQFLSSVFYLNIYSPSCTGQGDSQ